MIRLLFQDFSHIVVEVAFALVPLLLLFIFFQYVFLKMPREQVLNIVKGSILAFCGLTLFLQGVKAGFFPAGELIGRQLGASTNNWIMIPIGFILGFVATFAEPAVRILTLEVEKVSSGFIPRLILLYTLCIGVSIAVALSMLRVITGWAISYFIIPGYLLALLLTRFAGSSFTAIAFDSGGVATGPITVTFILAIAVGAASVMEGRDPLLDAFGMVSLVALAPILCVLILGIIFQKGGKS
ncbi:MAG: DUF1538 domain-containing protein [Clostridium sp.]|nr:DUF1538 domain-containing protein [Clostridium sp.]